MNLENIQSTAKTLLEAEAGLTGVPVLADDGTYPQTPNREAALATEGIVIIIWQIMGADLTDQVRGRGRHSELVELPITIEENRAVNLSTTGLGFAPEKAVRITLSALCGNPSDDPFSPGNPPWANFGNVDGVSQWIVNLNIKSNI
jgi:hypothetical protein